MQLQQYQQQLQQQQLQQQQLQQLQALQQQLSPQQQQLLLSNPIHGYAHQLSALQQQQNVIAQISQIFKQPQAQPQSPAALLAEQLLGRPAVAANGTTNTSPPPSPGLNAARQGFWPQQQQQQQQQSPPPALPMPMPALPAQAGLDQLSLLLKQQVCR